MTSIRVITYNVNGKGPDTDDLRALFGVQDMGNLPDMIVLGLQEVCDTQSEWKRKIMEYLCSCGGVYSCGGFIPVYTLVRMERVQSLMLAIFTKTVQQHRMSGVSFCESNGTAVFSFKVEGGSKVALVCSHLRPQQDLQLMYEEVLKGVDFKETGVENDLLKHDHVIWFGDLNCRIQGMEAKQVINVEPDTTDNLLKNHDPLTLCIENGTAFHGFQEVSVIRFKPTYKFIPGQEEYDLTEVPSWTDRILSKSGNIKCLAYQAHFQHKLSDHRPVSAHIFLK